jgi:Ni/Fe-hydrogenase subunit HybB-like protein
MANPLPISPGKIEGVWGKTGSFPFVPAECLMSLGIFALMGLLFLFGLKYLELLPADERCEQLSAVAKNPHDLEIRNVI